MNAPIPFTWTGDAMSPPARFARLCDKQFVIGETYPLVVHEDRSTNSHNHFFAAVHEAWKNLPERMTARYPTSEHLRKWALIKAGYADERSIACSTADEALRVAAFLKPMDDYAIVVVADTTIKVYTAKSQSARAMDKKSFQDSKQSVLDIVAELIGVDAATLAANAQGTATGHESAVSTNSSREDSSVPSPPPETMPAPQSPSGAGPLSSPSAPPPVAAGEPVQADSVESNPAQPDGGVGLPRGFLTAYSNALARASDKKSLEKRHVEVLRTMGEPSAADIEELRLVYAAYLKKLRSEITADDLVAHLRELGVD